MAAAPVLVVEDNLDIVLMLRIAFDNHGIPVVHVPPDEALNVASYPPDVRMVLVDLHLGKVSGMDVCEMLRRERPAMRIIVLSAYQERDQDSVGGRPYDQYLQKPAPIEAIIEAVIGA